MKLEKSKIYTTDVFVKNIYEIVQKKMGKVFNILDYSIPDKKIMEIKDIEFDVIAKTKWGGCEGIYTDIYIDGKYSLQGTTQGRYLTGGVPPVRFSM